MKKLFLISFIFTLVSCSQNEIPSHLLIDNGGVFYESGSKKPFNGLSIENKDGMPFKRTYYSDGLITKVEEYHLLKEQTLSKRTHFLDGLIIKVEEFYTSEVLKSILQKEDGEFTASFFDTEGNDISNELNQLYYSNGSVKQKGQYKDGEKDGWWKLFNLNGDLVSREYWVNGIKFPLKSLEVLIEENRILYDFNQDNLKVEFTGMVLIVDEEEETNTFIKVIDGRRSNFLERYYLGELVEKDTCRRIEMNDHDDGDKSNFNNQLMSYMNKTYLDECEIVLYFYDNPSSLRTKSRLWLSSNDQWNTQSLKYYKSGQLRSSYLNTYNAENSEYLDEASYVEEFREEFEYFENGSIHTSFIDGAFNRYNKFGLDISNGEAIGKDFNHYPYESWWGDDDLEQGYYKNGKKDGVWVSGDGIESTTYQKGIKNGPYSSYLIDSHKNAGCIYRSGQYVDGRRHGKFYIYNVSYPYEDCDKVRKVEVYDMGEMIE